MKYIEVDNLTKDYGHGRGIFSVSFHVNQGEVFGFLGPNGAGKTTTIRHLMGFSKPQKGSAKILGMRCDRKSNEILANVGYLPGEIAFPNAATGMDFLKCQAKFLDLHDLSYAKKLIERFQLDPNANLKRMSKGMKQKTAIVSAFMADPEILLLDEATTGLDPLMQDSFIELIHEEKARGKTIFMSSHMFDELESTCDRVAFLREGRIIDIVDMSTIQGNETTKKFKIEFLTHNDYLKFINCKFEIDRVQDKYNQVTISVPDGEINRLIKVLSENNVKFVTQIPYTLETYFKNKYSNKEAV
ncbi:MAG: ABC transporter ATP-binding protein [Oscillospiraceae bacterium]